MDNELLRSHDGHVTRLTLNRPTKANALSASLVEALINAVEYAGTDGTRLLILDGNGNHFCAGFDFTGYAEASEGDLFLRFVRIEPFVIPKRSLTGDSAERVDTRVLQIIFELDRPEVPLYVGQQVDVFIERAPTPVAANPTTSPAKQ